MSNKRRGLEKERELKKIFEKKGYSCSRGRGSFGLFDLICMNKEKIYLIQIKRVKGKNYSFKKEIQEIKDFDNYPLNASIIKELWIYLDKRKDREMGWVHKEII